MADTDRLKTLRRIQMAIWSLVILALGGMSYLLLRPASPPLQAEQSSPIRELGGPFTLTDADGKAFSSSQLNGKPYAIFFGFTHCPDVCPTTLSRMARLRQQAGVAPAAMPLLFVTVDPERDGPSEVGKYAQLFGAPIIGLTGSPAQIETVKKQYGIFSAKVPGESGDYSVDHTATVLLFGRDGKFVATIAPEEGDQVALAKLRRLLG
jgi:protein SCO1/2